MADAAKPDAKAVKYEPPKELESKAAVQKFMGRPKRQPVEQAEYFYSIKKSHIVMFVCSLLMLVSFILMFGKDYVRDWKDYQAQYADIEFERLRYEIHNLEKAEKAKREELRKIDQQISSYLSLFPLKSKTQKHEGRILRVNTFTPSPDPATSVRLAEAPWDVVHVVVDDEKAHPWEQKLWIREKEQIRGELYDKTQIFNFAKDRQGAVRYRYDEAKLRFEEAELSKDSRLPQLEKHFREMEKEWAAIVREVEATKKEKDEVEKLDGFYEDFGAALMARAIPELWDKPGQKPLDELKKERERIEKELEDKRSRFEKEKPSPANMIRNAPGLDFFKPSFKVNQVILGDLKDQLNFARIDKVDRCHTCHVGIANPTYAVDYYPEAKDPAEHVRFRDEFLRLFVDHALNKVDPKTCVVCDPERRKDSEMKEPLIRHGAWTTDDAIRFTKTFMAHPRLELFVGDSSKHPLAKMGCTICHEGDGRDTDFSRVVHTPNTVDEGLDWRRRHGTPYGEEKYNWNYRELWDLPMFPSKFLQASCRRCHADAVELDGAEKYVQGMKVFERAGCYGCHRTETYQILKKDVENPQIPINRKTRRPGPPLERIATKVTPEWMKKWVLEPRAFRSTTRMPHFFQLSNCRHEVNKHPYPPEVGRDGIRRSPIDDTIVTCIAEYILSLSETEKDKAPDEKLKGDVRRGELLVQQVGCMACHRIDDVAYDPKKGESRFLKEFAPTLRGIGSKVDRSWLYNWVRDPKKHFEQTAMGNFRLSEQEAVDVVEFLMTLKAKPEWVAKPAPTANGEIVDDLIRELLKKSLSDYETELVVKGQHPLQVFKGEKKSDQKVFDELSSAEGKRRWLGRKMVKNFGCYSCHLLKSDDQAIPKMEWQNEEGIGVELTGAQPFGSKHVDRLDFGNTEVDGVVNGREGINHFGVEFEHGFDGHTIDAKVFETRQDWLAAKLRNPRVFDGGKMGSKPWDELLRMPWFDFSEPEIELLQTFVLSFTDHEPAGLVKNLVKRMDPDEVAMNRGNRVVRDHNCRGCHRLSFDRLEVHWARTVEEGGEKKRKETWEWVEGRRLNQIDPDQAKDVIEKSGLLAPGEKFDEKTMKAYNLAWVTDHRTLAFSDAINPDVRVVVEFSSSKPSRWWYLGKEADGKPREIRHEIDMDGGEILPHLESFKKALNKAYVGEKEKLDNRNDDLDDLIKKAANNPAQQKTLQDEQNAIRKRLAEEFPTDDLVKADQMEGRFPPPLRSQGVKTQADWLFNFLKKPYPIRPNLFPVQPGAKSLPDVGVRMPRFDFSDEEANSIAHWFAVRDQYVDPKHPEDPEVSDTYPNTSIPQRSEKRLAEGKALHQDVLKRIVLDQDKGCANCHYIDGRKPKGDLYANAPEFLNIGDRLRPRWFLSWLHNPSEIYPRTSMTNYWGDPKEWKDKKKTEAEIQGVVDVLMNPKKFLLDTKK